MELFEKLENLFTQYAYNGKEIAFIDFVQMTKDRDLVPRILSYQGLLRIYTKMISVYLKTKMLESEKNDGDLGNFLEYVAAGTVGIVDRYLFIKCIMMIGCAVEYPRDTDAATKVD